MSIEKIVQYLPDILDEKFAKEACSAVLERNPKLMQFDFVGKASVKVPAITVSGLGTYSRTDGYPSGSISVSWETFTIRNDRGVKFSIDFCEDEEVNGFVLANTASEFSRTQEIPEIDATRFSLLSQGAYVGNVGSATLTADGGTYDVIKAFNTAIKAFEDQEVPTGPNAVFFISTGVDKLLKETALISRFITQGDYLAANGITYKVRYYEGSPIIVVPPKRFFSAITLSGNGTGTLGGYSKASRAVALNFLYVNVNCSFPVIKHHNVSMISPEYNNTADSYILKARVLDDLFLPTNKTYGVYVSKAVETYTVVFNANTGSGSMANQTLTLGTAAALTANTFTKSSNTFSGWNKAADGTGTDYADAASVLDLADGGSSITLYAKWTLS
jgi:hypothetical protein